jgi:hypothetical protein
MAQPVRTRRTRLILALTVSLLTVPALYWFVVLSTGPSYRGRSADWWAEELERGRHSSVTHCGPASFSETLPAPIRRLVPVSYDPEGVALRLGDPAAAPVLLALLRHRQPETRAFAAVALGEVEPPSPGTVTALVAAANDADAKVREAATQSLSAVSPGALVVASQAP